jgi:hypothetical protein
VSFVSLSGEYTPARQRKTKQAEFSVSKQSNVFFKADTQYDLIHVEAHKVVK